MAKKRKYEVAEFVQTLVYLDGPQLVLLKTAGASLLLAVAVTDQRYGDPYFAAEVSHDQLVDFLDERFDLRYLFEKPAFKTWYIADLAGEDPEIPLAIAQPEDDVRARLLPGRGIFARDLTEEIDGATIKPKQKERILVDGAWDLPDFSEFYGHYADFYNLHSSIDAFLDKQTSISRKKMIMDSFIKPWEGGGSYSSFYRSIRDHQNREDRLLVGGITYNSPGHIDIKGNLEAFTQVREDVLEFGAHRVEITKEYKNLHKYLSQMKLLSLPSSKFDKNSDLAKEVQDRGLKFASSLNVSEYRHILAMAGGDQLIAAKVLLSAYRRLSKLNEFFLQGRASFSI